MKSDDIYSDGTSSDRDATVTFRILPGGDRHAEVRLAGEIDMTALAVLLGSLDWLTSEAPVSVLVDLAGVTFAGSTLPNFVVRLRNVLPEGVEIVLWQPRPTIMHVLRVSGMAAIASIDGEPAGCARASSFS